MFVRLLRICMLAAASTVVPTSELFAADGSLAEDGRIGKVTDLQGTVTVKPVMHRRWTPVTEPVILQPGDWLRTDSRGANAVAARLINAAQITLGPGTLVELTKPQQLKLFSGELKIVARKKAPVDLLGPKEQRLTVDSTAVYHVDRQTQQLARVPQPPLWLQGFEGTTAHDSIGSLVANVDGRNVPLTVGYHKVAVDIRDQIARTVIEESFQNRTDGRLEGVFYFPLPQDASISGFGMWIGDELVEADVVEKQRAREIYETILRERRDPGLLEWTGGNLFKARVFPIEPNSEKRIKITYTQVLPVNNGRYRYSYGLQSEMLRLHPLREFAIDVKISSLLPLAGVTSPTHLARIENTQHSAHVEFSAQEYTPDRDFETVIQLEDGQPAVTLIPHRRGDDGYFMMLVTPPAPQDSGPRETLPDGQPLELIVLADTSGSMDETSRRNQADFLAALGGALTPDDRINVAASDVECHWVFDALRPATEENILQARDFIERRVSLGWTDLDKAFISALGQCGPKTQLIYLGDGVVTTGDGDPVAFSKRLRQRFADCPATLHAVSVGSSFESIVLNTIASIGGGSARQISGEQTPQRVAADLLREMTRPPMRDLKVEFRGLRVARVYPEQLPNLTAGQQQVVIGRYLPEGEDQRGEVIVAGRHGDRLVEFKNSVSLADAEQGNSFIPRLWARQHLDALLEQGTAAAVKDEIISLSEEYNIITPYTSLLVLESDADRERFKVKRRFRMRDGERFFSEGRDQADFELIQKQMRLAGTWRLKLRQGVLRELSGLGRELHALDARPPAEVSRFNVAGNFGGAFMLTDSVRQARTGLSGRGFGPSDVTSVAPVDELGNLFGEISASTAIEYPTLSTVDAEWIDGGELDLSDFTDNLDQDAGIVRAEPIFADGQVEEYETVVLDEIDVYLDVDGEISTELGFPEASAMSGAYMMGGGAAFAISPLSAGTSYEAQQWHYGEFQAIYAGQPGYEEQWLWGLFPYLPPAPPEAIKPPLRRWPPAAQRLSDSLLRTQQIAALDGGLVIRRQVDSFDLRWDELSGRSESLVLVSPKSWLTRSGGGTTDEVTHWCDGRRRGVFSHDLQLGRLRDAVPQDLTAVQLGLEGHLQTLLETTYARHAVDLRQASDDRVVVVITHATSPTSTLQILVDTQRNVVLWSEVRQNNRVIASTRFHDFVRVADAWWATRVEHLNQDGQRTSVTTVDFSQVAADEFGRRLQRELTPIPDVQFLCEPPTTIADAKQSLADGKAGFDDRITLMAHFAGRQDWDRVFTHLAGAEESAAGKPGMWWVRNAVLNLGRRREEFKQRIFERAERLAKSPKASFGLAEWLRTQGSEVFEANEMLSLLDVLKPAYERQPAYIGAAKQWAQQRIQYLRNTRQRDQVLALQRQLAERYPRDHDVQRQYAEALSQAGEHTAAYDWLDRVIVPAARWLPQEEDNLRNTYARLLRKQGRFNELARYLADWVARDPPGETAYARYLTALVKTDQELAANQLAAEWLRESQKPRYLEFEEAARLSAAVAHAMGRGYEFYTSRLEEHWLEPLAEVVRRLATHPSQAHVADDIMMQWRFRETDACRSVQRHTLARLLDEMDTLPPRRIPMMVNWVLRNDLIVETSEWRKIADGLTRRWAAESNVIVKDRLAASLVKVLKRLDTDVHLAFLRRQLAEGPQEHRVYYVRQLFDELIEHSWSLDRENEAFALLMKLSDSDKPAERLRTQARALMRLTKLMVDERGYDLARQVENWDELTRTEQREQAKENVRLAREAMVQRLQAERERQPESLGPWLDVERLYLQVLLKQNLDEVADESWQALGPDPNSPSNNDNPVAALLNTVLRRRHLTVLAYLAVRQDAKPAVVNRLIRYTDRGIAGADNVERAVEWKQRKLDLLIARDRPKAAEDALRSWIRPRDADNRWRRTLGYLMAELGRLDEAIPLFEQVEEADELNPSDYRALAGWYMAVDDRQRHEQALIKTFMAMDEWQLSQWLARQLEVWQQDNGALPSELDENVPRVFTALFRKSSNPEYYDWELRDFYLATRDFRLLTGVADAMLGHTAQQVYPVLDTLKFVLDEVRDEASADSIVRHLAEVRTRAKSDVDRRALDLVESLVERQSSQVLNQPEPHVARSLAAMQRAFRREWSDGEPRLMADFLSSLHRIRQKPLAAEQVRELQVLHEQVARGSADRLHIAQALARTYWIYERPDDAVDLLTAALDERRAACDGVLPISANPVFDRLVEYLEDRGHHARGERLLFDELKRPANQQQSYWFTQRLYRLYDRAIGGDGDVSLGRGEALYRAVNKQLQEELATDDHSHRYTLLDRLCTIYRTAHGKKIPGVAADVRQFAFGRLPHVLGRQTSNYQDIVGSVAHALHGLAGPRDGLELLIERIENEPRWFRLADDDGWSQHAHLLDQWRSEVGEKLGDLEPRLLAIVVAELRKDLGSGRERNRRIYHQQNADFWSEKTADFARAADEVYARRKGSGATVKYIADYLYEGLARHKRAIEILLAAHREKKLDEDGRFQLADYLNEQNRHGESIPILEPLVERRPDNITYRSYLMHAYFRTGQQDKQLALLKQTEEYFRQQDLWTELVLDVLARTCLDDHLFEQSAAYYEEVISLRQRTRPGRGIGNGHISYYYSFLSQAYTGMGKTPEAVDAACGAVVGWGPRRDGRAAALESLENVLAGAPDLAAYVAHLDKQTAETGQDNPIVRKALGKVYLDRDALDKAMVQLKLAVELQPNDTETHQLLVSAYDRLKDDDGAIAQLLDSVRLSRRNPELYQDLGRRYEKRKQTEAAERAYTSLVEALPNESEGHAALAEIRQEQNRWPDAIQHWRQVARIRELEPTGLLKLAAAQIHERQWSAAVDTCQELRARSWPQRFSDVEEEVRKLEGQIEAGRG